MDKFANIEALATVVDTGSFSNAAERLGIAKSVVSRRVSTLEHALGIQLLQRTTRTLSLTSAGRQFYARAVRILADLEDAEQSIVDASAALRGRLRLAAPLTFGLRHLNAALNAFATAHSGIELDIDLNDREINLVEEGFDMAVRIGQLADSTLIARRLGTARFIACASPAYLAKYGTPDHPNDMVDHLGLHYTNLQPKQAWRFSTGSGSIQAAVPQIRLRANNGEVLADAAAAGLGIVYLPTFIVADAIANGRLKPILGAYRAAPVGIHAVFPPGRLLSRRVLALSDHLAECFGEQPYWDDVVDAHA